MIMGDNRRNNGNLITRVIIIIAIMIKRKIRSWRIQ